MTVRYVDPNRKTGWFTRVYTRFSASRLGLFMSRHVAWKLDPYVLRLTRGRFGMSLTIPTGVLETRGAKSGLVRRNAVIYFHDGDRVTIIASKAGAPHHPAWFHNLCAHPDVTFGDIPMRATVVTDEAERTRLWGLADRVFPPFARYRRDAGREIPIVQLSPEPR
jgi:deazaflavin-dependent oxidoreductase (nitroreductase family)